MAWASPDEYFDQLQRWLEMEGAAERQRLSERLRMGRSGDPERSGESLVNLRIADDHVGLGGRHLITFAKPGDAPLPMNRLKVGSPVVLTNERNLEEDGVPGVVSRRGFNSIQVAVDEWPAGTQFRLDLSPDERTRLRQQGAIARARLASGPQARLSEALLGLAEPRFHPQRPLKYASSLNSPQEDAVQFALAARDVAILHGPPGTGKTTTLAELVHQEVLAGSKVLACAPSNTAVDNLLEKLVPLVSSVLRVGHPARVFEALRGHTLDELVEADESTRFVHEMDREADAIVRSASKPSRSRDGFRYRNDLYAEAKTLRQQARQLERHVVRQILDSADVICTTLTIDEELLGDRRFDLVVVDEACQATEPAVWQAMLRADRMVLAGDHCQLPPTVLSLEAAREGFAVSPMERLIARFGSSVHRRLTVQYRMHESIMRFSSDQFYDGQLVADASVASHQLTDLIPTPTPDEGLPVLEFWDTAGAGWDEELEPDGESKRNVKEAAWVVAQVKQFLEAGLDPVQIGVIAPYAAQIRLLKNRLPIDGLEIDTVDGFQGREKEVVVITFVRSNPIGEIGFLSECRRTNVALTRAKRALRVVGDSATLGRHRFYADLFEFFQQTGAYRSVWELGDELA